MEGRACSGVSREARKKAKATGRRHTTLACSQPASLWTRPVTPLEPAPTPPQINKRLAHARVVAKTGKTRILESLQLGNTELFDFASFPFFSRRSQVGRHWATAFMASVHHDGRTDGKMAHRSVHQRDGCWCFFQFPFLYPKDACSLLWLVGASAAFVSSKPRRLSMTAARKCKRLASSFLKAGGVLFWACSFPCQKTTRFVVASRPRLGSVHLFFYSDSPCCSCWIFLFSSPLALAHSHHRCSFIREEKEKRIGRGWETRLVSFSGLCSLGRDG
ncbi:hypothetical protein HDK77DRAFT_102769 [Phyllosticta capitalensis]